MNTPRLYFGDDFTVTAVIRDLNDSLVDPNSHAIKLFTPAGVQEGATKAAPTKLSTGVYQQAFTAPAVGAKGDWTVTWVAVIGATQKTGSIKIIIEDP